ncbi:Glutathione S-transferase [Quillaja saponaria]|uniref:Glutathione S-transferase n=1 Tax=Quillaja saponaria TaxID=32244 RepID=A0AAD7LKV7_QUISA|nr:Glutathione S-transferase [Quillaja saponaria]
MSKVTLLELWSSPFRMRVRIALEEKGVQYEVPVLLHDEKPVVESTNIVTYIDEVRPSNPLLPTSPYARAETRFVADFIDNKVLGAAVKIWQSTGEAAEEGKKISLRV